MNTTILDRALSKVVTALPGARPACGLILGSGLADIAGIFTVKAEMPGLDLWEAAGAPVHGHSSSILLAERAGIETLIFSGRRHWYEGLGWEPIALPVYVLRKLGASVAVLTNAAGGIRDDLSAGTLMIIDDHINAMGVTPLLGNNDPAWGARFADQSAVYDIDLRAQLQKAADRTGHHVAHGIYLATSGPTYETPAETRAFRAMGADAVGMSTVPEAMLANAAGLRVAGISCIANMATGMKNSSLSHDEVLRAVHGAVPALKAILAAFWDETGERQQR